MNTKSRSANSFRNISIGLASQILILFLAFISRTIFINLLGAEYLGLNGLYTNILTVLSLAELGIANVLIFSLYKPIAENDELKISALLIYYKKIFRIISISIFILGVILLPFLDNIVNGSIPYKNVVLYYLMFLLNSVLSYFVAYKTALINADQKNYIVKTYYTAFFLLKEVLQITVLIIYQDYFLFLFIQIVCTILNNIFISIKADKLYPFIKQSINLPEIETKSIKENIKSMFLYKIGVVLMNNTDNILISIIIGTIYVGYYSNYSLLIGTITSFIAILTQGVISSIGNLNASADMKKTYNFFNSLVLFFHWLSAFCAICILLISNDFVGIWLGDEYLLGKSVIIAIAVNFYIQNIINPVWMYRETFGLFNKIKFIMLFAAAINLILSTVLGVYWGLAGILLATAFARVLTTVWYEPKLLYSMKFNQPLRGYWTRQLKYLILTFISLCISIFIVSKFPVSLLFIFIKVLICLVVVSFVFFIFNIKNKDAGLIYEFVFQNLKRIFPNVYKE